MAGENNPIERDPASGRPLMRDIATKSSRSRLPLRFIEEKSVKKAAILLKKKSVAKIAPLNKFNAFILCGAIILLATMFIFAKSLSEVIVSVTPQQDIFDVESNLEASSNSSSAISLDIVSAEDTIELDGNIDKTSAGSEKAKGQIVIFNAYSTEPQTLVATTRFETPGGKIYRIRSNVKIPGGKMEKGKLIPGQLEATVYADKPGTEHNLGLSDFTIPGLKGTPKFEKIYARSKTEISGGSSGEIKIVTQEIVNNLLIQAQENFRRSMRNKIQKDLSQDVYIPESAIDVKITLLGAEPKVNSVADKVHIKAKVSAQVAVLKTNDLVKALSAKYLNLKSGESVEISNLDELNFQILSKNLGEKKITFKITGKAHFVWIFDEAALKKDLAGASRASRQSVFKNYPGIDRAEIIFKPSWLRFFPSDPDKIKLDYPDLKD
ncbi:hypothetical protein A3I27_03005 [Candidatus Giovannonibacteria bacterium RIFCSPLOWO2_02_FULL_43_11b]|uniref:Baseplate protein J-like domain-containing protein n=1 Tax=Candidatus Giovannonibacteria bacterium RIFCSPHIGHO2_12_FULL_43_15 TaxID=1798341 RepID=A0A1F5WQD4_9BACT|nr:MAG: hypothetical protein A2739_03240 [Candidatus Giovannonibacteria bacterium RIFCSPHIGHO2_01_FULL_43_100]OGF67581.1 MAG: hypothetical protein A3B97_00770 [Candidatus Giovannonibacteria bacterium RIFCSPHIGHO2_02_FULL_43_32]OGF77882.1 MAG: hypothetical protein A3F23_02530 [Candidatus Giovannonibacteria bacterium RIFCSPHIGHO2_12_FULL_43_15]OGF79081.1 MAG: hypothetical protein A3A15_03750 [Candidatus Giovannonibacteria bacterium RIFCSPLOWO2_01_FULL_43_60]OGF89560.1 MAG: hypothetical protein A3